MYQFVAARYSHYLVPCCPCSQRIIPKSLAVMVIPFPSFSSKEHLGIHLVEFLVCDAADLSYGDC